jgi:hypothetical protein
MYYPSCTPAEPAREKFLTSTIDTSPLDALSDPPRNLRGK